MHTLKIILTTSLFAGLNLGCSAPPAKDSPSSANNTTKKPITTAEPQPCIGTVANNFCKPATELTGAEKCWAKILGTEAATKCAAEGKVFNRITGVCISSLKLKAPCSETDVKAAFLAANFTETTISTNIQKVKNDIKTKLGVDAELDQCVEATMSAEKGGKTVLVPLYFGRKFSGGADGFGDYTIHAGKVCSSDIPACSEPNLTFPDKTAEKTPVEC